MGRDHRHQRSHFRKKNKLFTPGILDVIANKIEEADNGAPAKVIVLDQMVQVGFWCSILCMHTIR
jgi:hypothetical protein